MTPLAEVEHRMIHAIVGEAEDHGMPVFVTQGAMTGSERLEVYRSAYRSRLVECLTDDFPALRYALGEDPFARLCHAYIAAHPSRNASLTPFGQNMPAFVRAHYGERAERGAFLSDLARLEWAIVLAIHAKSAESLRPEVLAAVPPEGWDALRLVPCPWYAWLDLDYPVDAYYQAFRDDLTPPLPAPRGSTTVVLRDGLAIRRIGVSSGVRGLLRRLLWGEPLGVAMAELEPDADPGEVQASFQTWTASGLFSALDLRSS
jgi:hypothetical protein